MSIATPTHDFDFGALSLATPEPVQGGSFFSRLTNGEGAPLYVQLPECRTKEGVVTPKRNHYCDLMYEKPFPEETLEWIERLEASVRATILKKRTLWFSEDIDEAEVEAMLASVVRVFNSGKRLLLRAHLDMDRTTGAYNCMFYDERQSATEVANISSDVRMIPVVQFEGVRLASKSFDISVKLKQVMVLDEKPDLFQTCVIRREAPAPVVSEPVSSTTEPMSSTTEPTPVALEPMSSTTEPTPVALEPVSSTTEPELAPVASEPAPTNAIEGLEEVSVTPPDDDFVKIKNPNEVYYELYQKAREEAKRLRQQALNAYLEANKIKMKYDFEDSDEEEEF